MRVDRVCVLPWYYGMSEMLVTGNVQEGELFVKLVFGCVDYRQAIIWNCISELLTEGGYSIFTEAILSCYSWKLLEKPYNNSESFAYV